MSKRNEFLKFLDDGLETSTVLPTCEIASRVKDKFLELFPEPSESEVRTREGLVEKLIEFAEKNEDSLGCNRILRLKNFVDDDLNSKLFADFILDLLKRDENKVQKVIEGWYYQLQEQADLSDAVIKYYIHQTMEHLKEKGKEV